MPVWSRHQPRNNIIEQLKAHSIDSLSIRCKKQHAYHIHPAVFSIDKFLLYFVLSNRGTVDNRRLLDFMHYSLKCLQLRMDEKLFDKQLIPLNLP